MRSARWARGVKEFRRSKSKVSGRTFVIRRPCRRSTRRLEVGNKLVPRVSICSLKDSKIFLVTKNMRIGFAQINTTVGYILKNRDRILAAYEKAVSQGADL